MNNTYYNMNKKLIRLTESDLHKIVKESVKKILKEESGLNAAFKEVNFSNPDDVDAWNSIRNNVNSKQELAYKIIDSIYDGDFDNEISNGTVWKKIEEIFPDIDSFMYEKLRNEIGSAIRDQRAVADKDYAFRYGEEDHTGDDGYYEDEYGNWRNSFEDSVKSDLTYGDSYDWDTSDDPYDSRELRPLRNKNVFNGRGRGAIKGDDADEAWRLNNTKKYPHLFKKNGDIRKDSSIDRLTGSRSQLRGSKEAADSKPLHRKGSLNRAFDN